MKVNCISCGHTLSLDEAYDDYLGLVKCYVCGRLLEIKTAQGKILAVNFGQLPQPITSREQEHSTLGTA
jgi:DNA-directed RNA polymerase subunit N (RpoN/RPB10)